MKKLPEDVRQAIIETALALDELSMFGHMCKEHGDAIACKQQQKAMDDYTKARARLLEVLS